MAYILCVWETRHRIRGEDGKDKWKGMTMLRKGIYRLVVTVGALLAALQTAGCAGSNPFPLLSSGPSPRVEDCMLLQQATPTKYVCGGKTYTAVQLADIRSGKAAASK